MARDSRCRAHRAALGLHRSLSTFYPFLHNRCLLSLTSCLSLSLSPCLSRRIVLYSYPYICPRIALFARYIVPAALPLEAHEVAQELIS